MDGGSCIFCDLQESQDQSHFLFNNELVYAIRDINPRAPVHILIIPKKHISDASEIMFEDADILSQMFVASTTISKKEGVNKSGYRLAINKGKDANMTINHLHMHLLGGRTLEKEG